MIATTKQIQNNFNVQQAFHREMYRRSPVLLGNKILGYDRYGSTHVKWNRWLLPKINLEGTRPGKFVLLQPRETFKTTFFTITLSIAYLLNNPNLSILIVNERYDNAKNMLKEIKGHFEKNETFRALYGDWVSRDDWSKESITVNRKIKNLKEPSIAVAGIGSALTTMHPDIIICDDIAGKKDKESDAGRTQTLSFFQDVWDLLKKDNGVFIMPGTRKHVHDIYYHVLNNVNPQLKKADLEPFHVLITPAHEKGDHVNGKLNFPDILTHDKLRELRIVKEGEDGTDYATYMAEYELTPLDPKTQVFKTFHFVDHKDFTFQKMCLWTDPAIEDSKGACYSAVVVVAKIKEGNGYQGKWLVLYASIEKRNPTKTIEDHNRIYWMLSEMYPDIPFSAYMEANGFQTLMKDITIKESLRVKDKPPVPTIGKKNMTNKDSRIKWLEPHMTSGVLLFRKDFRDAPENYRLLIEQLQQYPQAAKDGPDALQGAYKRATSLGPRVMSLT